MKICSSTIRRLPSDLVPSDIVFMYTPCPGHWVLNPLERPAESPPSNLRAGAKGYDHRSP